MTETGAAGPRHEVRIPFILHGRRVTPPRSGARRLELPTGDALLPIVDADMVGSLVRPPDPGLAGITTGEVIAFLRMVGQNWKEREYARRQLYVSYLISLLGYSEKMAQAEANWIAVLLSSQSRLYDQLDIELGSRHLLDRWVPVEEADVRAFPLGTILHVLAGNVPASGVVSMIRSILTRNCSLVKMSSDDPVTAVMVALSFLDVDPDHPVSRSLSVVQWRGGDVEIEGRLVPAVDGICVWGARGRGGVDPGPGAPRGARSGVRPPPEHGHRWSRRAPAGLAGHRPRHLHARPAAPATPCGRSW